MHSFDKFIQLYKIDSRFKTEIGEGFLWYHCQATGEKSVDIPMVLEYHKASEVEPPAEEELAKSFQANKSVVIQAASARRFRIKQDAEIWFKNKFEEPVFELELPLFVIRQTSSGSYVHDILKTDGGDDHRFGRGNRPPDSRGAIRERNRQSLSREINRLEQQWDLLSRKLAELKKQRILETRAEEKFRLQHLIDETQTEYEQVLVQN